MTSISTEELIENNKDIYLKSSQHAFLTKLGESTLDPVALERFLNQDRVFALGYSKWLGIIAGRIPLLNNSNIVEDEDVKLLHLMSFAISNGLREVNMFPNTLKSLGLKYESVDANAACHDYIKYLYSLPNNDEAMVALWALEKVYLDGWGYAKSLAKDSPYAELLNNWTAPSFVQFVDIDLKYQVERIKTNDISKFNDIFAKVCQLEIAFWESALLQ